MLEDELNTLRRMRHTPTPESVAASPVATPPAERPKPRPKNRQIVVSPTSASPEPPALLPAVKPTPAKTLGKTPAKTPASSKAVVSTRAAQKARAASPSPEPAIDLTLDPSDDDEEEAKLTAEIKRKGYPLPEISAYHVGGIVSVFLVVFFSFYLLNFLLFLQDYRLYPRLWKLGPPEYWATRVLNPKKHRKNHEEVGPGVPIPDYAFSATEPLIRNPLDSWFNCFPGQLVCFYLMSIFLSLLTFWLSFSSRSLAASAACSTIPTAIFAGGRLVAGSAVMVNDPGVLSASPKLRNEERLSSPPGLGGRILRRPHEYSARWLLLVCLFTFFFVFLKLNFLSFHRNSSASLFSHDEFPDRQESDRCLDACSRVS